MPEIIKADQLDEINKLVEVYEDIHKALEQARQMHDQHVEDGPDSGGYEGIEFGYAIHLSSWKDGSGPSCDMSNCYVAGEMIKAAIDILNTKLLEVKARLLKLGVSI